MCHSIQHGEGCHSIPGVQIWRYGAAVSTQLHLCSSTTPNFSAKPVDKIVPLKKSLCLTVEQTLDEHTILNAAPAMHVGLQIQLLVVLFSTPLVYSMGRCVIVYSIGRCVIVYSMGRGVIVYSMGRGVIVYSMGRGVIVYSMGRCVISIQHGEVCHSIQHGEGCHSIQHGEGCHSIQHGEGCHSIQHGEVCHSIQHGEGCHNLYLITIKFI